MTERQRPASSGAGDLGQGQGNPVDERAALRAATTRLLAKIAQGAEDEVVIAITPAEAIAELVPLLDRLIAVGDAAFAQHTPAGWSEACRRTFNAHVLIRVSELRHAAGVKMDYVPSTSGDKEAVLEWLAALRRLRVRLPPSGLAQSKRPSDFNHTHPPE